MTRLACPPGAARGAQSSHRWIVCAALAAAGAVAHAQASGAPTRGQLLYETHCITCHTTQVHWRDRKLAKDWDSLQAQVRLWQGAAALQWSDADIAEVARHLDETIYRFARAPTARLER